MSIADMTAKKRNISEADRVAAAKLRSLWEAYKKTHGVSQEAACNSVGFSQAAFSQYLGCKIALNVEATIKFARLLGVKPQDIRQDVDFGGIGAAWPAAKHPPADYVVLSPDAVDIARTWIMLPEHRRQCIREALFLEAAISTHYPWLRVGRPQKGSYAEFEKKMIDEFAKRGKQRSTKAT